MFWFGFGWVLVRSGFDSVWFWVLGFWFGSVLVRLRLVLVRFSFG